MGRKIIPQTKYGGTPTLEVLEGANNYNSWIAQTLLPYTTDPIIEVGAGIGNITKYFLQKGTVIATDNQHLFLKILKQKYNKHKKISIQKFDITSTPPQSLRQRFQTAVAINVMEHIEDDTKALRYIRQVLQKDGRLLLLVPAKKFAYTKLDQQLGHFRRYEKAELQNKLEDAKYIVEKIFFFNALGILSWIVRDYISNTKQITKKQMKLFDWFVPILRLVELKIKPPIGISLIAVARKK